VWQIPRQNAVSYWLVSAQRASRPAGRYVNPDMNSPTETLQQYTVVNEDCISNCYHLAALLASLLLSMRQLALCGDRR
jgi:hypothetical protein